MKQFDLLLAASVLALASAAFPAFAHGEGKPGDGGSAVPKEQKPWGIAGDAKAARRTIEIRMGDDMRFTPGHVDVKQGETVRFVIRNAGKLLHEMVIGTPEELKAHAELMRKHPGMEHDEPYMAHVASGKRGTMVWNFNRAGSFQFACLIPGHFEAGMVGTIVVRPQ
jgi:uncharacterized cupredoxin-like copper-binding protein